MTFGSAMESQNEMAQRALRIAAERNNVPVPAPAPAEVVVAEPCAEAVGNMNPYVGTNEGGK